MTPEQIIDLIEIDGLEWENVMSDIKGGKLLLDDSRYPRNDNFYTNAYNYYSSGAHRVFKAIDDREGKLKSCHIHEMARWLLQNPKLNNFVKHPLTGDTIWHKECMLSQILIPPIYDKKITNILDVYTTNKDSILALENFYGRKVYTLLKDYESHRKQK